PKKIKTFERRISFLRSHPRVDMRGFDWTSLRRLRNESSHPSQQTIVTPAMAYDALLGTAKAIDDLFHP
ncbi:MAG: hypothetical protein AB7J63_13390, partial [Vicinamibacterales bacterium]